MNNEQFADLVRELRTAASTWFADRVLVKLEALIAEAERARHAERPQQRLLTPVRKRTGYAWPGVVVSRFQNLKGEERVVVECTAEAVRGALHIFNSDQIEPLL